LSGRQVRDCRRGEVRELSPSRVSIPDMGAKKTDDGTSIAWAILLFLLFLVVAWPY
jgi:hypothetical protein